MEDLKSEVRVMTWLSVIAEIARSRLRRQLPDTRDALNYFGDVVADSAALTHGGILATDKGRAEMRKALLMVAAVAIRIADEQFPGDGLEL